MMLDTQLTTPIRTRRPDLVLKPFDVGDGEAIFALIDESRDHLSQYGGDTAAKYPTLESVISSIVSPSDFQKIRMGIWYCDMLIGSVNLRFDGDGSGEIGYYLGKDHTGCGYMFDAVVALTEHALAHGLREVYAGVDQRNQSSVQVLQRAGYAEGPEIEGIRTFSVKNKWL